MNKYYVVFIEEQIEIWRKEGKTWEEINILRKQMPACKYPSKTYQLAKRLMKSEKLSEH